MPRSIQNTLTTIDESAQLHQWQQLRQRPTPRLVLRYHSDLSRIGATTLPGTPDMEGTWCEVGRLGPSFALPWQHQGTPRALDDPYISRQQLQVRWCEEHFHFEVRPSAYTNKRIFYLEAGALDQASEQPRELQHTTSLPPGSLLILGRRAILSLELSLWRAPDTPRLEMVGESEVTWLLREQLTEVARFSKPVLLLGETGTGKELAARAIHGQSERRHKALVAVNCASIPRELTESVLFGHRRGAFTGANQDQEGLFVQAHQSSLLLDEVGELPMAQQAALLRVLQEGKLRPVGSQREQSVDVRLITATNREPEREILSGQLRRDLFYRIAGHTVRLPPLRERRGDVCELMMHFLRINRQQHPELGWMWASTSRRAAPVPLDLFLTLLRMPWPGNVRQVENVAEQLARLNTQPGPFRLPEELQVPQLSPAPQAPPTLDQEPSILAPDRAVIYLLCQELGLLPDTLTRLLSPQHLRAASREHPEDPEGQRSSLRQASAEQLRLLMQRHDFNQTRTALELGISRTTLLKLMGSLELPRPRDITREEATRVLKKHNYDMQRVARELGVSRKGLVTHLRQLGVDL